ncbi:hypothetical protein ACOSQ2_028830 [Xanthoceras sorbifolium]
MERFSRLGRQFRMTIPTDGGSDIHRQDTTGNADQKLDASGPEYGNRQYVLYSRRNQAKGKEKIGVDINADSVELPTVAGRRKTTDLGPKLVGDNKEAEERLPITQVDIPSDSPDITIHHDGSGFSGINSNILSEESRADVS